MDMEPIHILPDEDRQQLHATLAGIEENPYKDYPAFARAVAEVAGSVPESLNAAYERIRAERQAGTSDLHVLRNCPIDEDIPELDRDDPLADKYRTKTTFVAEAFLELHAQLVRTPLLAYATRFNGDFFIDVIAHNKYRGKRTGFSDGELEYHNDRTAHPVRADYICLLGMCCPDELVYTTFVGGRELLEHLPAEEQETLRRPYFVTPFDVFSKDRNNQLTSSPTHPILENERSFRYLDTHTSAAPDAPAAAKDAIIALKNALVRATKQRHRILTGDLLTFANQDGLHSREMPEIADPELARTRWLLKTYAFRDRSAADRYAGEWAGGVAGLVGD
jgi:L-asparagine oxygenase